MSSPERKPVAYKLWVDAITVEYEDGDDEDIMLDFPAILGEYDTYEEALEALKELDPLCY